MSKSHEADSSSSAAEDHQAAGVACAAAAGCGSPSSTSSPTKTDQVMAESKIPNLYEYWKAPTVDEDDISNFHTAGWLPGDLVCSPTSLEFKTIDRTNIAYFELHLMCSLRLPPSKFLITILNCLGCELIHLHPNAIDALSCFSMLCECWLGIPPDTFLF
jgi:hypothetical protein